MSKYICYPVKIESTGEIRLFNFVFDQSDMVIEDKILDDIYFKLEREGDYTVLDLFYSDAETPEMVAEDYFATELRKHIQNFYFVGDEYIQQPDRDTISFEFEANLYTVKLKKVKYDFLEGRIQDYHYQVYSYQDGMKSKEIATDALFTGFDFSVIDELVWGEFDLEIPKFAEGGSVKYDHSGNLIGDGSWHIEPEVYEFTEYPQIKSSVDYSQSTESTYVTYRNTENDKKITVRFSEHESNAVKFGDQLNGVYASKNKILYYLGLKKREFVPDKFIFIGSRQVAKKELGNYEEADKTIQEMYALGANADISMYKGKIAKGSNYLIIDDIVSEQIRTKRDFLGNPVQLGKYIYKDIDEEKFNEGGSVGDNSNYTIAKHREIEKRTYNGEITIDEFKNAFDSALKSEEALKAELEPLKKDELLKLRGSGMFYSRYKNERKDRIIEALVDDIFTFFALGSYSYTFGQDRHEGVKQKVASLTQKSLDDYAAEVAEGRRQSQERREKIKAILENPQTLADFNTFLEYKKKESMTPEQAKLYDELVAQNTKERQEKQAEQKAVVKKVEIGEGVDLNIYETKHTKTGQPLYVVKLSERVDPETYKELNRRAKQLGGYYSSYTRDGAIAGFQFKEKEQADKFVSLKEGDVSNVEKVEERKEEKAGKRADKLRKNAEAIIQRVDEELNKDRLTNTAKRAAQATSTESRLHGEKAIAKTMINIADAIDSGQAKYLDLVRTKAQIEQLDTIVKSGHSAYIREKYPDYTSYESHKYDPITEDAVNHIHPTYLFLPRLYSEHWIKAIDKNEDRAGLKNISAKIRKYLGNSEYYTIKNKTELNDFLEFADKIPDSWETNRLKEFAKEHKRLESLGIESDEMLRALLREFILYRGGVEKVDRAKELERKLAGRKVGIDFFPTPKSLAIKMVRMAEVEEGMSILEPSAGNGNIADAIREETGITPDVCEISSELAAILEAKGYTVVATDFMELTEKKYDRIIMNPPFSSRMDAAHVKHAYELLKPNGRIVSIMGEGVFFGSDNAAVSFRDWIDEINGEVEKLPESTFTDKTLYATTGANARLVIINKPAEIGEIEPEKEEEKQPETPEVSETEPENECEPPAYGTNDYHDYIAWQEYVKCGDKNDISFADFKRGLKAEWDEDNQDVIHYYFDGKEITSYNTREELNYAPLRQAYYKYMEEEKGLEPEPEAETTPEPEPTPETKPDVKPEAPAEIPLEERKKQFLEQAMKIINEIPVEKMKEMYNSAMSELLKGEQDKLDNVLSQIAENNDYIEKSRIEEKDKVDREKYALMEKRSLTHAKNKILKSAEIFYTNNVNAIINGGSLLSVTDKLGKESVVADYTKINTADITFTQETILSEERPIYVPVIDEDVFASKGYVFDAIRIGKDNYIMAVNGYKYARVQSRDEILTLSDSEENGFVMLTLDQLVLTNLYYIEKAKAIFQKQADERNTDAERRFDNSSDASKERFLMQKGIYHSLPAKIKKTITQEEYEKLGWQDRVKIDKFLTKRRPKQIVSRLSEDSMWASFHFMYNRFLNPAAIQPAARVANSEVWAYWATFRDFMNFKIKDIEIQREDLSEIRKAALETSFGMSNTNESLKAKYGVLVKHQDGSRITPDSITQISTSIHNVYSVFANLKAKAIADTMKISHTQQRYIFASKAIGTYIPQFATIACSGKFGETEFQCTLAHEAAHWIDNLLGRVVGKRFATDDYESLAGQIAFDFRRNMNVKSDNDYINATKECFARAMQQYFAITVFGDEAETIYSYNLLHSATPYFTQDNFVGKDYFYSTMKPMIEDFLKENKPLLEENLVTDEIENAPEIEPTAEETQAQEEADKKAKRKRFLELEAEAEAEALALMEMEMEMESEK